MLGQGEKVFGNFYPAILQPGIYSKQNQNVQSTKCIKMPVMML